MELDSELESQLKEDEYWWDAHGTIPETYVTPHACACTPDKVMCVGTDVREDNLVSVYQCQECGNEEEFARPLDETEFMT